MKKNFLSIKDLSQKELLQLIDNALEHKQNPSRFQNALQNKNLLMMFAKPSLRTRLSFEVGMQKLGGRVVFYDLGNSVMGKKESIHDTAKTISRYIDIIMARVYKHEEIEELAEHSDVPVINGLTNFNHPCQVLGDLLTIKERFNKLEGLKLVYFGDANNNVTHSLMYGCKKVGINLVICCPDNKNYTPDAKVQQDTRVEIIHDPEKAIKNADIVYTDSWMSYHIPDSKKQKRMVDLKKYTVTAELMKKAKPDAVFMHCLPAQRGVEVDAKVIDGKQSIVFDQAENRMYAQNALMIWLLV